MCVFGYNDVFFLKLKKMRFSIENRARLRNGKMNTAYTIFFITLLSGTQPKRKKVSATSVVMRNAIYIFQTQTFPLNSDLNFNFS